MAADVLMPQLSDSMQEGVVLAWLKSVGEVVAAGEPLVEIETDKANMVCEAEVGGTLLEILVEEGAVLPVGAAIARIGSPEQGSGTLDKAPAAAEPTSEVPSPASEVEFQDHPATAPGPSRSIRSTPLARRIAADTGVDLSTIKGSGPAGRVTKEDVRRVADPSRAANMPRDGGSDGQLTPSAPVYANTPSAATAAKGEVTIMELSRLQKTVARRMAESKATAPHFYLHADVDVSRAVAARKVLKKAASGASPSFNDMVVKACALALQEHPRANGSYRDGRLELYSRINIGVAVAAADALVVATIFDADLKGLRAIATETRRLATRVRAGEVTPPELSGGTFTVSNLGMYGTTSIDPVINPPQAGILGVGAISEMPLVRDGEIVVGHVMRLTLACDHRILYGADAAQFLATICRLMSEPAALAL